MLLTCIAEAVMPALVLVQSADGDVLVAFADGHDTEAIEVPADTSDTDQGFHIDTDALDETLGHALVRESSDAQHLV
jgi:hypothetical protein